MFKNYSVILYLSALIVAMSVAYYFIIYIPKRDNQKFELQRQEIVQKNVLTEQKKTEEKSRQESLSLCLTDTEIRYKKNWNQECKSQGKYGYLCSHLVDITLDDYMKENNIPGDKGLEAMIKLKKDQDECSCRLPLENSDRIDKWRTEAKNDCYKKYPN